MGKIFGVLARFGEYGVVSTLPRIHWESIGEPDDASRNAYYMTKDT